MLNTKIIKDQPWEGLKIIGPAWPGGVRIGEKFPNSVRS